MRTALVTGGSRGIGAAVVRKLHAAGWQVAFVWHSNREAAAALERELPGVAAVQADVADPVQAQEAYQTATRRLGPIHALVCCAGIALPQKLTAQTGDEEARRVIDVDLLGTYWCCRAAARDMAAAHTGAIVTVSSVWGRTGGSCEAIYSAAKAGVIGLTRALAKELGPAGVRVNCVCPGVIDTDMNAHLTPADRQALAEQTALCRLGTAEEIAAAIAFLCEDEASFITGAVLDANGGFVG